MQNHASASYYRHPGETGLKQQDLQSYRKLPKVTTLLQYHKLLALSQRLCRVNLANLVPRAFPLKKGKALGTRVESGGNLFATGAWVNKVTCQK